MPSARMTVDMVGLAEVVLRAKSVERRMERGRKPERDVSISNATPVRIGWYTDLGEKDNVFLFFSILHFCLLQVIQKCFFHNLINLVTSCNAKILRIFY